MKWVCGKEKRQGNTAARESALAGPRLQHSAHHTKGCGRDSGWGGSGEAQGGKQAQAGRDVTGETVVDPA